jgi:hypothetical protein
VVFKHSDSVTAGIPDVSFTWRGYTSWLEVKFVRPEEKSKRGSLLQEDVLRRLSRAGHRAWWIVFSERGVEIIDPVSNRVMAHAPTRDCAAVRSFVVSTHNVPLIPEGKA